MLISGQFAEIMEGIKALGEAAKASLPHIEGKVWEQLIGVDLTQPIEDQAAQGGQTQGQTAEKLSENDIVIEQVEKVLGALAGIVAAEIVTGGAITAALPVIINAITTAMNAAMVVSIIDTMTFTVSSHHYKYYSLKYLDKCTKMGHTIRIHTRSRYFISRHGGKNVHS